MSPLAERAFERLLGRAIALDADAVAALRGLGEFYLVVEIEGVGARLLQVYEGGVRIDSAHAIRPDARVRGSLAALARLFLGRGPVEPAGGLTVEGDRDRLARLVVVMRGLDPDWEEPISALIGDVAAHHLSRARRGAGRWLRTTAQALAADTGEQLQHESGLLPSRPEWSAHCRDVAALEERLDGLERRVATRRASG